MSRLVARILSTNKSLLSHYKFRLPSIVSTASNFSTNSYIDNINKNMELGYFTVSYVTTPSDEVAKQLSRRLVSGRLAACVNLVHGVTSIYEWQGKLSEDSECLMVIKSHSSKTKQLIDTIRTNHPYDCPEIITTKIEDGSQEYLRWLQDTLNRPLTEIGK